MRVLLLKEPPDDDDGPSDDPYRAAFAALGWVPEISYLALQHCEYDDRAAAAALGAALCVGSSEQSQQLDERVGSTVPSAKAGGAGCGSVVVTTQRACIALTRALPLLDPEPELRWRDVARAYVVGPRTAALVEAELPHLEVVPAGGAAKASELLDVIDATTTHDLRPLLRVHSSQAPDSLTPKLQQLHKPSGLTVLQAAVYGLVPVAISEIRASLQSLGLLGPAALPLSEQDAQPEEAGQQTRCCWVVCFSPLRLAELAQIVKGSEPRSGLGTAVHIATEMEPAAPEDSPPPPPLPVHSWMLDQAAVRLVAMGPTTRAALERLGLPCAATAATPSPHGIATCIIDAMTTACAERDGEGEDMRRD